MVNAGYRKHAYCTSLLILSCIILKSLNVEVVSHTILFFSVIIFYGFLFQQFFINVAICFLYLTVSHRPLAAEYQSVCCILLYLFTCID